MLKYQKKKKLYSSGCAGKVKFATREEAFRASKNQEKKYHKFGLEIYLCRFCKKWHLGHGRI